MNTMLSKILLLLNSTDPSAFFILSLFPYIIFLYWAQKCLSIPRTSLIGFRLTLLFVLMTIIFAIISLIYFGDELTNIDPLHGAAEAFLTLSDAFIAWGFIQMLKPEEVKNS